MMEKIRALIDKAMNCFKSNKRNSMIICIALVGVLTLIISLSQCNKDLEYESQLQWGDGITQGIPQFDENFVSFKSDPDGKYHAMYFENVTTEQVQAYENELATQCGITFKGELFPRSAIYNDKIIVIHYNVTEMKFSVTVTQKSNS